MPSALVTAIFLLLLRDAASANGNNTMELGGSHLKKRSILTFPPDSILQLTMGITLAGKLQRNNGVIVLALQQNAPLPVEPQPLLAPSLIESGRKSSVYDHLKDIINSYGFRGGQCLKKMICQIAETPLVGGLLEDVLTFLLSPSKHRSVRSMMGENWNSFVESEQLGRLGGNCTSAFPKCGKTPLDMVSSFIHI